MMRQPAASGQPRFATFKVETVNKADARKVHYFSWPETPDPEPDGAGARAAEPSDATPEKSGHDGV
jgi:hypothetical protein